MENINAWLLLTLSVASTFVYGILRNVISKKHIKSDAEFYLFNALSSIIPIVLFLPTAFSKASISTYTLLIGTIFGMITVAGAILTMAALKIGPMSYTYLIITLSCAIPSLSGFFIWDEAITAAGWVGIVLMLVSFVLLTETRGKSGNTNRIWLIYCFGAFILNGIIGIIQKIHQSSPYRQESGLFLTSAFVVSLVLSVLMYYFLRNKKATEKMQIKLSAKILSIALLCGLFIAAGNLINLYLSGVMDSAVFFPIVNGGGVVLSTLAAVTLFGEKIPVKRAFGLVTGIISILLISGLVA